MLMSGVIIVILIVVIFSLIMYNMSINKKIKKFKSINQRITNLQVVQDFINTIGKDETIESKFKKINQILVEKYEIKYSTIVIFDGAEYVIKASNVEEKHWSTLNGLHEIELFTDSISTATPKYVTVNNDNERLPYQKTEFGRAKSAIFFPLYIDNVYIGYWIIESGTPHDFDNVDTTILEVIKDNIVSVLKSIEYQKTLESIVRKDQFSGLFSETYLYGEGKRIIDKYTSSTICMFKITNIEEINKKSSRELGNEVIIKLSEYISKNISKEYIFIRYMGPKFVIAFGGVEISGVANYLKDIKNKIEDLEIIIEKENENGESEKQIAVPTINFVLSTYYKGTGMEEVLKKEEEYLDNADNNESNITSI